MVTRRFLPFLALMWGLLHFGVDPQVSHVLGANVSSDALIQDLQSSEALVRSRAFQELLSRHRNTIDGLLIVGRSGGQSPSDVEGRRRAMVLVGELRAVGAVSLLAPHLGESFHDPALWSYRHPLDCYPAARALLHVGSPAVTGVLTRVNLGVSEEEMNVIAWWFYSLDGKELGLCRLKLALKSGKNFTEDGRANLARLIKLYESIDFNDPRQWPRPRTQAKEGTRGQNDLLER